MRAFHLLWVLRKRQRIALPSFPSTCRQLRQGSFGVAHPYMLIAAEAPAAFIAGVVAVPATAAAAPPAGGGGGGPPVFAYGAGSGAPPRSVGP